MFYTGSGAKSALNMFVHYNGNQGGIVQLKVGGRFNPSSLMCLKCSAAVNNLNIVYSVLTIQNVETAILENKSRQGNFSLTLSPWWIFYSFTAFSPTLPTYDSLNYFTSVGTVKKKITTRVLQIFYKKNSRIFTIKLCRTFRKIKNFT